MHHDAFQDWKRERDAIEQEMRQFLAAGRRAPLEERAVRRIQFAALIERRNAAARNLLQSVRPGGQTTTVRQLSASAPTATEVAEQGTEPAGDQTATVLQSSASPPTATEVAAQGRDPAEDRTATVLQLSTAPPMAAEMPEQRTEPAAFDRAPDALLETSSEDAFNFDVPPPSTARPEDPALAKASGEERLSDDRPVEAQPYLRIARSGPTSARFLQLWRVRYRPTNVARSAA
jgi:hypothetical protein